MASQLNQLKDDVTLGNGVLYQYASTAIFALSSAAFYIYIAHVFPPYDLGSVTILLSILALFPLFFSFGLQSGWLHFTSYEIGAGNPEAAREIIRKAIIAGLSLSSLAVVFLLGTGRYIAHFFFHSYSYESLIYLLAVCIPPSLMISFFNSIMMGLQNFRKAGIIGISYTAVIYGITIPLIDATHQLYSIPIGWGIGYTFGVILFYLDLRKRLNSLPSDKHSVSFSSKDLLVYSLPLYLTGILGSGAMYIDRLTVALLRNLDLLGIYNLALVLSSGVALLGLPLLGVIFSKFSEFHARKDSEMLREGVRVSTSAISLLYIPGALGLAAISLPLMKLLGGVDYSGGALPMVIIVTAGAISVFGNPCSMVLRGTRRNFIFILSASLSLTSNLVFSFLLIPIFSLVGAAIAYALTTSIRPVIAFFYARKMKLVRFDIRFLSRIWVSAIVMSAIVYLIELVTSMRSLYLPVYALAGFAVYFLLIRLTAAISQKDKELFASFIPIRLQLVRRIIFKL